MITCLFEKQPRILNGVSGIFCIFCLIISGFFLFGCGSGSDGLIEPTGELVFQVEWETPGTLTTTAIENGDAATQKAIACKENGIFWVNAIVYDGSNADIAESELWPCDDHGGIIPYVPVGSKRKVVLFGKSAEKNILYRGETGNITVSANGVKNIGLIKAFYFVPTEGVYSIEGETFSWKAVTGARSYQLQVSRNIGFIDIEVDRTLGRVTSIATPNLFSYEDTHYWRIRAIDFDGYESDWSHLWHFGAPPENQVGPVVWSTTPRNGETNVSRDLTRVTVLFNKPMNIQEGNVEASSWEYVGGGNAWVAYPFVENTAWDNTGQRLNVYGTFSGAEADRFRFRLTGFRDPDGNLLNPNPYEFEFTIASSEPQEPPRVVSPDTTDPIYIYPCGDLSNINIEFSKQMDTNNGEIYYTINEFQDRSPWPSHVSWSNYGNVLYVEANEQDLGYICESAGSDGRIILYLLGFRDTEGLALVQESLTITYQMDPPPP